MVSQGYDVKRVMAIGRLTQFARMDVTVLDRATPLIASIQGKWSGTGGYYREADQVATRQALGKWAKGVSLTPPVHRYIYDEYHTRRNSGEWPPKKPDWYNAQYPDQLVQHYNLAECINQLGNPVGMANVIDGGFAQIDAGTWNVTLRLGAYFGTWQQKRGRRETGVNYIWIHEFGFPPHAERSFVRPALERAAAEWELNWQVEVEAAARIGTKPISSGVQPIITSTKPGVSTLSSIVHKVPQRHLNWVAMLLWLLPVNRYISILAAIKDVRGAITKGRLSAGSIRTWLQSQVMGTAGMTVKSRRKSFRKKLYA